MKEEQGRSGGWQVGFTSDLAARRPELGHVPHMELYGVKGEAQGPGTWEALSALLEGQRSG